MDKLKMHSPDMTQENIKKIQALFPNCVTEARDENGKLRLAIDFDQLKQELSDSIVEGPQERYHLNWPGKREASLLGNSPIAKTLRPSREESVNFDSSANIFIEGDNLDALKLMQESYLGKFKVIYIDPPYNTGNDFIYNDTFIQSSEDFLKTSNQVDHDGAKLTANPSTSGRFHSEWISMMYPRLKLARNLLMESGVIFLSIDDNEVGNLLKICDEIFGADNFVGSMSWLKKRKGSFLSKKLVSVTEWLLVYGKSPNVRLFGGKADAKESQPLIKRTNTRGVLDFPGGVVETKLPDGEYSAGLYGEGSSSVKLLKSLEVESGVIKTDFALEGPFIWGQNYLDEQIRNGARIVINTNSFQVRAFKAPDPDSYKGLSTFVNGVEVQATNEDGYEELRDLLKAEGIMSYPKPVNYIKYLIRAATHWDRDAAVLDFFAGSSTTAHAVMKLNSEDGGNRSFVMIQLPEKCDEKSEAFKAGYDKISEISKERIRRAGKAILAQGGHTDWQKDIGFRVLKVDNSNMSDVFYSPNQTSQSDLNLLVDNIKPDRNDDDLLFQVLLDSAVELTLPITVKNLHGKPVYFVDDNALVACFAQGINEELVKELAGFKPLQIVFRDDAFESNAMKINAEQIFKQLSPNTIVKAI